MRTWSLQLFLSHWKHVFSWSACKGQWRTAFWRKWIEHPSRASAYHSCPSGLAPAPAQWLLQKGNLRGLHWGSEHGAEGHLRPKNEHAWDVFVITLFSPCSWPLRALHCLGVFRLFYHLLLYLSLQALDIFSGKMSAVSFSTSFSILCFVLFSPVFCVLIPQILESSAWL